MAKQQIAYCFALLTLLISVEFAVSADPPTDSPAPSQPPAAGSPLSPSPHSADSPPAPPPSDLAPNSSPSPSPDSPPAPPPPPPTPTPAPSPSKQNASDVNHTNADTENSKGESSGMSAGKKAGIAFGVIIAVGVVAVGGFVYKKRQDNLRRSQFGFAARRDIL